MTNRELTTTVVWFACISFVIALIFTMIMLLTRSTPIRCPTGIAKIYQGSTNYDNQGYISAHVPTLIICNGGKVYKP